MKIPNPYCFLLLFLPFLFWTGCSPSAPKDQKAAKERVLTEIGVASEPSKPTEISNAPTAMEPKGSAIGEKAGESQSKDANSATRTQSIKTAKSKAQPKISIDAPGKRWIAAGKLPRDLWEVQYLGNAQVGFSHKTTKVAEGSNDLWHELDSRIRVSVKNMPQEQRIQIKTLETDNGELKRVEGLLEMGSNKQFFEGTIIQDVLKFRGEENGQPFEIRVEWKKDYRGPFAVEQSMLRKPLEPGETRKLKYFDPLRRVLIDGELDAKDYIQTPTMLGGSLELLEVRSVGRMGEGMAQSLFWLDKEGEGLKSFILENDILSFRTKPIDGQIFETCTNLRALSAVSKPLTGDIEKIAGSSSDPESVTYRFEHKTEEFFPMFTDKFGQDVKTLQNKIGEVTVYRNAKELDPILATIAAVRSSEYLANSNFISKDLAAIQKLGKGVITADKSLSNDSSTSDKAKACQRAIRKGVKLKDYDIQIRPMQLVLKSRKGNCVEHATLLASVCRSLGIPSRIAIGIKFNGSKETPAMQFHTWVEILDDLRWIPMDSSQEEFSASVDRVKFRDSDFNAANPYLELLEVYKLLPELKIEVRPL